MKQAQAHYWVIRSGAHAVDHDPKIRYFTLAHTSLNDRQSECTESNMWSMHLFVFFWYREWCKTPRNYQTHQTSKRTFSTNFSPLRKQRALKETERFASRVDKRSRIHTFTKSRQCDVPGNCWLNFVVVIDRNHIRLIRLALACCMLRLKPQQGGGLTGAGTAGLAVLTG